jgi:hypothetical protein
MQSESEPWQKNDNKHYAEIGPYQEAPPEGAVPNVGDFSETYSLAVVSPPWVAVSRKTIKLWVATAAQ